MNTQRQYFIGLASERTYEIVIEHGVFAKGQKGSFQGIKPGDLGILYVTRGWNDNDLIVGIFEATSGGYEDFQNAIFGVWESGKVRFPYRVDVKIFKGQINGYQIHMSFEKTLSEIKRIDPYLAKTIRDIARDKTQYKLDPKIFLKLVSIVYGGIGLNQVKKLSFDNIVGFENLKNFIKELIPKDGNWEEWKEGAKKLDINPKFGILLFGPPGTGKTYFAKTLSKEIGAYYQEINAWDIQGYPGEAEERIRKIFDDLLSYERAVLFVDEAEWILRKRDEQISSVMQRVTPTLLAQLSRIFEYEENYNLIFVIMTTNKPHMIDEAFLRPGRFGKIFYVEPPNETHIKEILRKGFESKYKGNLDLDELINHVWFVIKDYSSKERYYYSVSDIVNIIKDAKIKALSAGRDYVIEDDIYEALKRLRPSIPEDMLKDFEDFARKWNAESVHK